MFKSHPEASRSFTTPLHLPVFFRCSHGTKPHLNRETHQSWDNHQPQTPKKNAFLVDVWYPSLKSQHLTVVGCLLLWKKRNTTFGGKGTCNLKSEKMLQVDSSSLINKTCWNQIWEKSLNLQKLPFSDPFVCPKEGKFPEPMLWHGDGISRPSILPDGEGSGFLGIETFEHSYGFVTYIADVKGLSKCHMFLLISSFKETTNVEQYYSTLQ